MIHGILCMKMRSFNFFYLISLLVIFLLLFIINVFVFVLVVGTFIVYALKLETLPIRD